MKEGPREKPLGLDMPFDEAFARFLGTDPKEVSENIERGKQKRGPPKQPPPVDDESPD
ncbi:hypothetical protein [Sphingomonas sp. dw_22]|uniref:hypothetical protein n=1 Tax=Sphingomonas sp. dw_22 TaxID=2721175 RepID=UPI001BD5D362|nr:hypothetical protein [Sphingomonas sp. dw_22]